MADSRLENYFDGTIRSLTFTSLASLASAAAAESLKFDNSSLKMLAADIEVTIKSGTSPSGFCTVYMAPSLDGTVFPGGATGADAGITAQADNLIRIGSVGNMTTTSTVYKKIMSLEAPYGLQLPPYFSIIVVNSTGATLFASGSSVRILPKKISAIAV